MSLISMVMKRLQFRISPSVLQWCIYAVPVFILILLSHIPSFTREGKFLWLLGRKIPFLGIIAEREITDIAFKGNSFLKRSNTGGCYSCSTIQK
ncbi:hypothetical protein CEXT_582001 [Caerostris extrusa]|uniref:Uncharacterized protein n=1 Tax=Caerostris extrusa TaxID=172846 RepID=A0AAV4ME42_CAEEX|nr:hypothetical protein CEXT_582001 [Caerostris extrusa]